MFNKIKEKINNKIYKAYKINSINIAAALLNNETFKDMKNLYEGKEVVLVGAGPSLNKYIPLEGTVNFALNRAITNKKIKFDYLIADDWDGISFITEEVINYKCIKLFGHQNGDFREIPQSFVLKSGAKRYYTDCYKIKNAFFSDFVCDIDKMAIGNMPNIALSAMQILLFTNPKRIYLVGCDASSNGHFNEIVKDEKMMKRHEEDLKISVSSNRVIEKWRELKSFADIYYPDTEIVSINPVGLKGLFKDIYQ